MVGAQVASRILYPIFGPRREMCGGLIVVAASMAGMALIGFDTSLWWARLLMFTLGLGISQVFIPAQAASFATITPEKTGRASTLFNTARQLGGAIGVAILTTVVAAVGPLRLTDRGLVPNLSAYHASFLAAAGIALLGVVAALTVRDQDASATMVRRGRFAQGDKKAPIPAEVG
jgi:MFS family permease